MKLLLDECVTSYLKPDLNGHDVATVEEAGLKGLKNGKLIEAASVRFEVLITVDQNIQFQQNLENLAMAIVILKAPRSTYPYLRPLIPKVLAELDSIKPGEIITVF